MTDKAMEPIRFDPAALYDDAALEAALRGAISVKRFKVELSAAGLKQTFRGLYLGQNILDALAKKPTIITEREDSDSSIIPIAITSRRRAEPRLRRIGEKKGEKHIGERSR